MLGLPCCDNNYELTRPPFQLTSLTSDGILEIDNKLMKTIPQKFLEALTNLINRSGDKTAERLAARLESEPDKTVEQIAHHIGSQTGPIKLR